MEIFDEIEQGSDQWRQIRCGLPTTSMFSAILAKGRGGAASKTRAKYLRQLAGERLTGEPMETFQSAAMERGTLMESEARDLYIGALSLSDNPPEVRQVGFIRNGAKGCSPDALVGDEGLLELKTARPDILIEHILRNTFPSEHLPQCHGQIWVSGREWCDLLIYYPKMPPFQMRLHRDEEYIRMLEHAVDRFNEELEAMVEKVKSYAG